MKAFDGESEIEINDLSQLSIEQTIELFQSTMVYRDLVKEEMGRLLDMYEKKKRLLAESSDNLYDRISEELGEMVAIAILADTNLAIHLDKWQREP